MSDDGILVKVRGWLPPNYSIRIGDTRYVFPAGQTREECQSVLDEAKQIYLRWLAAENHDPGDEDFER